MKYVFLFASGWLLSCTAPSSHNDKATPDAPEATGLDTTTQLVQATSPSDPSLVENDGFVSYVADAASIKMYWKRNGENIYTFGELKKLEPGLKFAMNGGMFTRESAPVGLYVENGKQLKPLKRYNNPKVNFGLQPQGIFLIKEGSAAVIPVETYAPDGVRYATQSAPMLVLDSKINPRLPHSESSNIRNGVGILPNGKVLLVLSRKLVTFQEFAQYFVDQGCTTALYLDGGVSEAYVPGYDTYGFFGVLIGVVKK